MKNKMYKNYSVLIMTCFIVSCNKQEELGQKNLAVGSSVLLTAKGIANIDIARYDDRVLIGVIRRDASVDVILEVTQDNIKTTSETEVEGDTVIVIDENGDGEPESRLIQNIENNKLELESTEAIIWKKPHEN